MKLSTRKTLPTIIMVAITLIVLCIAAFATQGAELGTERFYNTPWALLPPVIAITLALVTKEVYSSLFVGILAGGLLYSNFSFEGTILHVFNDGIVSVLSDSYNVGILVFIDDYFNCLTVGSVMRPVTDKHNVSRAKLSYLIDATAAPVCIITPISSWAAAVSSYVEDGSGLTLFIKAIPFNYYALLTITLMIGLVLLKADFGPMGKCEFNAKNGDLFSGKNPYASAEATEANTNGRVIDLVLPIIVLIVACVTGMIYSGGFFDPAREGYHNIVTSFSGSDTSVGLMLGSSFALVITIVFYQLRKLMSFSEMMGMLPEGFKAMVPAILILTCAWSLKAMTDSLGAGAYVASAVKGSAQSFQSFLPAIVFLIGCFLSFATGTSWGTFGILIPITLEVFPITDPIGIICVSACMAGAVCGDHCSPISDTTIMASAGAQCDHVMHVSTQLPYAITCAAVSFVSYIIAGFVRIAWICLPIAIALMLLTLVVIKKLYAKKVY